MCLWLIQDAAVNRKCVLLSFLNKLVEPDPNISELLEIFSPFLTRANRWQLPRILTFI